MIKNTYLYIFFILINNIFLLKFRFRNFIKIEYNHDFSFTNFKNLNDLKKILVLDTKIFDKNYDKYFQYHSLDWLWTAKRLGGADLVKVARDRVIDWNSKYKGFYYYITDVNLCAKRLINLIYNYDFYASSANRKEKIKIKFIIFYQYTFLKFILSVNNTIGAKTIEINKAIILYQAIHGLLSKNSINELKNNIKNSINPAGMHYSMNPDFHAEFINNLIEIKNIFLFYKIEMPKEIEFQIINMTSVLKNFFHKDDSIALFNGSSNNNIDEMKKIISITNDIKTKNLINNKDGLAIYSNNQLKIFFDVVKPENKLINYNLHASTLSFELSYKNEKIITNCGTVERRNYKQPDYLRYSAAHSTIILNNTNISELIEKQSYKRIPSKIFFEAKELKKAIIWNASHDGYIKNFNKIVKRKLIISKEGCDLTGKDQIISVGFGTKTNNFCIRFHLTPLCTALLTRNKKSVIIKTLNNKSFIFKSDSALDIEESIYIEKGKKIIKTSQIVILGNMNEQKKTINWSFSLQGNK